MSLIEQWLDWALRGNRAFTNPQDAVGDAIRLFDILLGVVSLGLCFAVARKVRNSRQYGIYACICYGVVAISTCIDRLGQIVTFRLPLCTAGVVFALIYLWKIGHERLLPASPDSTSPTTPSDLP